MRRNTWNYIPCIAIFALAGTGAQKNNKTDNSPMIAWTSSLEEALKKAKQENRPIFVAINVDGAAVSNDEDGVNDTIVSGVYADSKMIATSKQAINLIASPCNHSYFLQDPGTGKKKKMCSRFKTVSCEEHQNVEKAIRKNYFQNVENIVTPQHLLLKPTGELIDKKEYDASAKELEKMIQDSAKVVGKPAASAVQSNTPNKNNPQKP